MRCACKDATDTVVPSFPLHQILHCALSSAKTQHKLLEGVHPHLCTTYVCTPAASGHACRKSPDRVCRLTKLNHLSCLEQRRLYPFLAFSRGCKTHTHYKLAQETGKEYKGEFSRLQPPAWRCASMSLFGIGRQSHGTLRSEASPFDSLAPYLSSAYTLP